MNSTIATGWALACLAVVGALLASSRRLGRLRTGAWLVLFAVILLAVEEPVLTLWLAFTTPDGDPDGIVGLVTPTARAHVLDSALYSGAAAVLLGSIAMTGFRRGERLARRLLTWALAIVAIAVTATTVFISSRGLPLPVPADPSPFGWQPVAVALLAWAAGLWLARPAQPAPLSPAQEDQLPLRPTRR